MILVLRIISFLLRVLNIAMHSIGVYALATLYQKSKFRIQRMYIINLSISTLSLNVLAFINNIPSFIKIETHDEEKIKEFQVHVAIIEYTGVSFVYYFLMMILTLDRLASVTLGLRYPQYWTPNKAKYLLITLWIIGVCISIGVSLADHFAAFNWEEASFKYFYPILELTFLTIASSTYGLIFRKRVHNIKKISRMSGRELPNRSGWHLRDLKKSFFFVPSLMILTFVTFMIVPDLVYLFIAIIKNNPSETLTVGCSISYATSNAIDGAIYIYFLPDVRKFLVNKVRNRNSSSFDSGLTMSRVCGKSNQLAIIEEEPKSLKSLEKDFVCSSKLGVKMTRL